MAMGFLVLGRELVGVARWVWLETGTGGMRLVAGSGVGFVGRWAAERDARRGSQRKHQNQSREQFAHHVPSPMQTSQARV